MMEDATLPLTHLITAARFRYVMLTNFVVVVSGNPSYRVFHGVSLGKDMFKTIKASGFYEIRPIQMGNGSSLNMVVHGEFVILQGAE